MAIIIIRDNNEPDELLLRYRKPLTAFNQSGGGGGGLPFNKTTYNLVGVAIAENAGFDKQQPPSTISPATIGPYEIYACRSFGVNFLRVDLGESRVELLKEPAYIRFQGLDNTWYLLGDLTGSGYSYGVSIPGVQAYLVANIGVSIQVEFSPTNTI